MKNCKTKSYFKSQINNRLGSGFEKNAAILKKLSIY